MKEIFKNDKPFFVKKCVAIALILFGMVFVLVNKDVYYSEHESRIKITQESLENPVIVEFQGNKKFEQEFNGWNGELKSIGMRFSNQGNQAATGVVTFNILDQDGNVLQTTQKNVSNIRTTKKTSIRFEEPAQLSKDSTYTLQVIVEDASNPQGFGVLTYPEKGELFGQLFVDGQAVEERLGVNFYYNYYNMKAVRDMYILFILALIFICIPFGKVDKWIEGKYGVVLDCNKIISRFFFFASPILCFMMADRINGYYLKQMIHRMFSWRFVFNMLIYIVIWLIIYAIVNRVQYASMILLILAFVADIANYYVWIFRGCPILATDLQSAKTALNVAQNFSYNLDLTGVWGVVYILSFVAILLSLKGYKGINIKKRGLVVVGCVVGVVLFNTVFFQSDIVKNAGVKAEVWHPQSKYAKNGTALSFVLSWSYTKVEKPSGYSADKVAQITESYVSDQITKVQSATEQSPNIIAIMNESLADLSYNGKIEFSEDYLPFIHSLEENTVKGKLYVSIQGANTANSEFEFLTGNSMTFLPFRCIPYNLYINGETPSMAQNMQAQGYSGVNAYHPYLRSGWNRSNVYPLLGFNEFYSQEYYYDNGNDSLVRNYISDESDFAQIEQDYEAARTESDAPFYLFNVTMQNHGGYDGQRGYVDTDITILDDDLVYDEAEQYINLAKKSDTAFQHLVEYFEQVDEPTMIVMFGDHQPPLTNSFYAAQFGKNVNNLSTKQQSVWYSTPYVIWANYDIEEAEVDMSANYLSSYVMNLAGVNLTGYNKYLLELQKTLPVISAVCYMDAEGNVYANDEESEYSDLIEEYQMIQYNELFDEDNRLDEFFFLRSE
jgi:phosphoglycerol transferase MdoB-like AlkP superfamily enzyme